MGWSVESRPFAIILSSRKVRCAAFRRRLILSLKSAMYELVIRSYTGRLWATSPLNGSFLTANGSIQDFLQSAECQFKSKSYQNYDPVANKHRCNACSLAWFAIHGSCSKPDAQQYDIPDCEDVQS